MCQRKVLIPLLMVLAGGLPADAQPIQPAAPKEYQVYIRYRIHAGRNERVQQFYPMLEYIDKLGFQRAEGSIDPDLEAGDANMNQMIGRMPSATARRLLEDPRIKTILLLPPAWKMLGPEDAEVPVKVQIDLVGSLPASQQKLLHDQTRARIAEFGFKNGIAYDHRGWTRLIGTIHGGELLTLLKDIRGEPSGWLEPLTPLKDLPMPLQGVSPLRVIEVIPEPDGVAPVAELPAPAPVAEPMQKIGSDLRQLMADKDEAAKPVRLEIILAVAPADTSVSWEEELINLVPQLVIEGRYGPVVTGVMPAGKAADLAASPLVVGVRLPRSGVPVIPPNADAKDRNRQALAAAGLARLHGLGHKGKGVRVGVIGGDFRGWEEMVKAKRLPATTRLLDLTVQRTSTFDPEAYPKDEAKIGHGTQCAMALGLAAPEADLLLIRIDPAAPHQLLAIARHINGNPLRNQSMLQRRDDLNAGWDAIQDRWKALLMERRELLEKFDPTEKGIDDREQLFRKVRELKDDEAVYTARLARFLQHQRDLQDLAKLQVVVNTLLWHEGHAVDGTGPLSLYLSEQPFRGTFWFQPAGDIRGQVWTGMFRDTDDNQVMEFAPPSAPLPRSRWTRELNFLGWQTWAGPLDPELPEKAKLRITVQWREPHDPEFLLSGEDLYREPLAAVKLMLLRQRDPQGAKLPSDSMELVEYSRGSPLRIDNQPGSSLYQQTLEFSIDKPAYYALRIEGRAPTDIRPPGTPSVPAIQKGFDLRLRVLAEVTDAESRAVGRPVLIDFASNEGTIGMPGDSRSVFTIGAVDRNNRPQPYGSPGPAVNLELLGKPNFLTYDGLDVGGDDPGGVRGSSIAASFAAGLTATALGANIPPAAFLTVQPPRPGSLLQIPAQAPVTRR
jgi:hypothetical protein